MTETPLRLLIIDDSPADRELYHILLSQIAMSKYYVLEAETGEAGLALYQAARPDCILLDYRLPGLNGLELLTALASETGQVPLPVIVLSGAGNELLVADFMKAGAADYIPKSVLSAHNLEAAITNAVAKHRRRAAWEVQRLKMPPTAAREFLSMVFDILAGPQERA
ncbi:MAG TPA: response regulator [Candidatus Tectomicrobia bacterium]|jgi:DNA-binding NarL/FixJ family response regulator